MQEIMIVLYLINNIKKIGPNCGSNEYEVVIIPEEIEMCIMTVVE